MKKHGKGLLTVLVSMLLVLSLILAGCTGKGKTGKETPKTEETKKPDASGEDTKDPEEKPDDTTPTDDPKEDAGVTATLYLMNDNADAFAPKEVTLKELSAQALIDAFIQEGFIEAGTTVQSFTEGANLELDLSSGFQQSINNMGESGEYYLLGGVVNTFLQAYQADTIHITIDGGVLETPGAGEMTGNLGWYD